MIKKGIVRVLILIVLCILSASVFCDASETDIEKDLQQDLQQSKTIIRIAEKKLSSGSPIISELQQLKELAEKIKASHLLLQEQFRIREEELKIHGTKAQDRHREMEEGYLKALGDYLNLVESLQQGSGQRSALSSQLNSLKILLEKILPKKKRPIFGSLPYRNLNYPSREPISTPVIRPAYKGGNKVVSPDDTKSTEEAPISEEIANLAQSLNWKPVAIIEYMKANIETEWYWGCMKGAEETLRQKSGNDCDQATLLTALLRASGFPTRYIRGTMEFFMGGRDGVSLDKAKNLVGIEDPAKIAEFFQKAGIPYRPVIQGGKITNYQIEHIWVESRIPYGNYRGTMIDNSNPRWLGLDTSIKTKGYTYNDPLDIYDEPALSDQLSGIRDEYLGLTSNPQPVDPKLVTPLEYLKSFVNSQLADTQPVTTYDDFLRSRTLIIKPLSIIPDSMQFDQKLITHEYTEIPDELKHKVKLSAFSGQPTTTSNQLFEITLDTMKLSNKRIAITYEPETVEDQQIIDSYGGLDNTPAYLVRLRPVLKVDGERIVVGKDGLPMGNGYELTIELTSPNGTEKITNTHIVGNLSVIGIVAQTVGANGGSPDASEDKDAEQLLYEEAMNYIDRWNRSEEELASLLHLTISRPIPTVVTVGGVIDVTYLLDMPHGFEWKGVYMDADMRAIGVTPSRSPLTQEGGNERQKTFMELSGLEGSVLEHKIFEDDWNVESISTAKLFQISNQPSANSGQLYTIDKSNIDSILPSLTLDDNVKEDVRNSVNQNLVVHFPQADSLPLTAVSYKDWSGIGYIKENPETGEAGYMLSGMIAGGMTTVRKEDWIDQDIKNALSQPTSQKTNTDPESAVRIARLNIKEADNKSGIVGTKMNKPFEVIALDKNRAPVQDVIITFKTIAGGGKVQGVNKSGNPDSDINTGTSTPAAEITVKTGPDGIARAKLTLGEQTSVSPYYRIETNINNEPYWELTGLNLVSVNATTIKKGKIYTDKPFEAYGRPGEAVKIEKTSPLSDIYGIPNLFATTVWLKVTDKYGNSISNKQVKISVQDDPSTGKNAKLYANLDDCKGTPDYSCEEAKIYEAQNPLTKTTEHFGAMAYMILGDTEKTKYTVTVSAKKDEFNKLVKRVDTDVDLDTITFNFYTKSMGGADAVQYLSVMSAHIIDEKGNNIDAGTAGQPFSEPLKAAVYLSEEGYKTDVKENCTENCYYLKGTGVFETTPVNDGQVEFKPTLGGGKVDPDIQKTVIPDMPGHYSTVLTLGPDPSANIVQAIGTKTVTVPTIDSATGVEGQTQKELSGSTNIEVWGLKITVPPYKMIALNDAGYLLSDVMLEYTIDPQAYRSLPAEISLDIFEKPTTGTESWIGFVQADNDGKLILSQGTANFNMDNTYYAQVVLNRGTRAEIRSEKIMLFNSALIPDYDRNGVIDDSDRRRTFAGDPFYFWVNDDDDKSETEGSDIPGEREGLLVPLDNENGNVDSIRDLIDFFPVYLDIKSLLKVYDTKTYAYKLQSENESLNFILTDLEALQAGYYLRGDDNDLNIPLALGNAETYKVNSGGTLLNNHTSNPAFLEGIKDSKKGVILLEGEKVSDKPLELAIYDSNQKKVFSMKLNLSLSGVEQMFRHKNLVEASGGPEPKAGSTDGEPDRFYQPLNYPDKECTGNESGTGKNFIFLHGYNVNGKEARGWQSEIFKRMFWSGSRAKFWGVTWYGWYSQIDLPAGFDSHTINFYRNIVNAFKTSEALKNFISTTVAGEKIVAAHSLGNMVVSSAITDYNAPIDKYIAINAAVALEAFDSTEAENSELIPPGWDVFLPRLRASEWYKLFQGQDPHDYREELTWRDRFASVKNVTAYNFYSTGDEVVSSPWQLQEQLKGSVPVVSYYGGWVLNMDDYLTLDIFAHPERANALSDADLRERPLFDKHGLIAPLLVPGTSGSNSAKENRNELLARAFPATTWATGRSYSLAFKQLNYDMQTIQFMTTKTKGTDKITFWPREKEKWLHSDLKDVAFTYVFCLFDSLTNNGGLK